MKEGYVFNIQHFSVHDGPGIRTIVFMKGCPLSCVWCSNPESHSTKPEVAYNPSKCIGSECKRCLDVCEPKAITWHEPHDLAKVNFNKCTQCLKCAPRCPSQALSIYGEMMTVDEVLEHVEKDMTFYTRSNGGVTFSGGEPFSQADFLLEALEEAKKRSIHGAIETSGHFRIDERNHKILSLLDYFLIDLKHVDNEKHQKFTGVPNTFVVNNLKYIHTHFPETPLRVRTPVIPFFNNTEEEIRLISNFVKTNLPNAEYELLKYHNYGRNKYDYLGRQYYLPKEASIEEDFFNEMKEKYSVLKS